MDLKKISCPRMINSQANANSSRARSEVFVRFNSSYKTEGVMCDEYVEEKDECKKTPNQSCIYSNWKYFPK